MNDILADMENKKVYNSYEEARDEMEIAKASRKKRIRFVGIGIAVLVVLNLLVGGVNAFEDTYQNHPSDDITDKWVSQGNYGTPGIIFEPYLDTKIFRMNAYVVGGNGWSETTNIYPFDETGYWSWNVSYICDDAKLKFWDVDGVLINTSDNLATHGIGHWELLKSGQVIALYVNGVYKGSIGGKYAENPYYITFRVHRASAPGMAYWKTDDFSTNGNVLGTVAHDWYVLRNIDSPVDSGLYDESDNKKYTHKLHTSYTWRKTLGYDNYASPATSIITKYFFTGEVVNTTFTLNTTTAAGIIDYNLTDMLFRNDTADDKYGLYYQQLMRGSEVLATDYFWFSYVSASLPSSGTISFDKDSYVSGEIAIITHHLDSPDFSNYYYKGFLFDADMIQKETWSINSGDGTENIDLAGYDAGNYYAILRIDDKSSDWEADLAFDVCALNEEILIEGITYNAETEVVLGTVNASFLQGAQYYNATSNTTTGEYNVSGLSVDIETDVNATKTNYTHNDFSFTPLQVGLYEMDIFMLPNISYISYHNTSIGGLVQSYPFYQNVSGAIINIWNATWSNSTTANMAGYYIFENLTNGTYSINASSAGYLTSDDEEVETNNGSFLYHYILLQPQFVLTVKASDVSTHASITDFTAIVNDVDIQDTANGSIDFTVGYGIHKVEASAEGYYASLAYVYVDETTEKIMYLTPLEGAGGTGTYYPPPHLVEFRVINNWGNPYSNVNVTAIGIETTMTTWDKIKSLFGLGNTSVQNETMSGTTDSNGGISFMMVEVVKYKMTFLKGSEVNETIYIYPKEDHYKIIIGNEGWVQTDSMWDVVNYSILAGELNDTHTYINFSYRDANNKTSELYYFVNQSNGTTTFNIYNHSYNISNSSNIANSYIVKRGEAYFIGFEANNNDYGEIKHSLFIRIFEKDKRLLEFDGVPDYIYTYLSIGLLCLVGAFFGMITVPEGGIVICLEGWILWFVGWFLFENPLAPLYLTVATVFAILIIFAAKGRQKGVS